MLDVSRKKKTNIEGLFSEQPYQIRYVNLAGVGDAKILVQLLKKSTEFDEVSDLETYFVNKNPFGYATKSTRGRHFRSIKPLLLDTVTEEHKQLLKSVVTQQLSNRILKYVAYLQICINSRSFREITLNVYGKKVAEGVLKLLKNAVNDYILEEIPKSSEWTKNTIDRLGSRYIKLMSMFGFIESDSEKISLFSPSNQLLSYAVYLHQSICKNKALETSNPIFRLFFEFDPENIIDRLKRLALDDYFDIETTGTKVKVNSLLTASSYAAKLSK